MTEEQRIQEIIKRLQKEYSRARIALEYKDPFQLLVAVILSAQCTDKRVNMITPRLFERFPGVREMAEADVREIEEIIRSCGFFRNKAKNIKAAASMILAKFGGRVPDNMEDIIRLPGVARKTGNVVLYNAYGVKAGIAVDTHVKRLARRLGLSSEKDPVKIERDLMEKIPKDLWGEITYLLIDHGRKVCKARKPDCENCILRDLCPYYRSLKGKQE